MQNSGHIRFLGVLGTGKKKIHNFLPNSVSAVDVQNQPAQGLGTPQNRRWAKKSIFSKSEISTPQSNHGKRNIKLMLVRP